MWSTAVASMCIKSAAAGYQLPHIQCTLTVHRAFFITWLVTVEQETSLLHSDGCHHLFFIAQVCCGSH